MALFARTTTLSANFPGTYEQVYLAAFAAVYALGYTPDMADPNMRMICYSTPTTAFTWGVNVTIGLVPQQGQVVVEITAQSLWPMPALGQEGRNKKIINAAFEQINAALAQGAPQPGQQPQAGGGAALPYGGTAFQPGQQPQAGADGAQPYGGAAFQPGQQPNAGSAQPYGGAAPRPGQQPGA